MRLYRLLFRDRAGRHLWCYYWASTQAAAERRGRRIVRIQRDMPIVFLRATCALDARPNAHKRNRDAIPPSSPLETHHVR